MKEKDVYVIPIVRDEVGIQRSIKIGEDGVKEYDKKMVEIDKTRREEQQLNKKGHSPFLRRIK